MNPYLKCLKVSTKIPFGQPQDQVWIQAGISLQTYQMRAHFEAFIEGVLMAPLNFRCTQVGLNLISVQVWCALTAGDRGLCFQYPAKKKVFQVIPFVGQLKRA